MEDSLIKPWLWFDITNTFSLTKDRLFLYIIFIYTIYFHLLWHCVKSVRIRRFSGLYFPASRLNTEIYSIFSLNAGKYGAEKLRIRALFTQCEWMVESLDFLSFRYFWINYWFDESICAIRCFEVSSHVEVETTLYPHRNIIKLAKNFKK